MARHAAEFVLQAEHLEVLQTHLRSGKTEYRVARRSRILLLRAEGVRQTDIAEQLGIGRNTVWRIEERYREEGLGALRDHPRPGRPRVFSPSAESTDDGPRLSEAI
jgi:DNA-directed RNA polymerase specialized sigma24 family protein